jgi:hypothetical protein
MKQTAPTPVFMTEASSYRGEASLHPAAPAKPISAPSLTLIPAAKSALPSSAEGKAAPASQSIGEVRRYLLALLTRADVDAGKEEGYILPDWCRGCARCILLFFAFSPRSLRITLGNTYRIQRNIAHIILDTAQVRPRPKVSSLNNTS